MHFTTVSSRHCAICGTSFWGFENVCGPCEVIIRSWVSKGFVDLCRYLEKVTKFEAYLRGELPEESSEDPAPAETPQKGTVGDTPAVSSSEGELDTQ